MKEADRHAIAPRAEIIEHNRRQLIVGEILNEAALQVKGRVDAAELLSMTSGALQDEPDGSDMRKILVEAAGSAIREIERIDREAGR